jgi:hypothetical protein
MSYYAFVAFARIKLPLSGGKRLYCFFSTCCNRTWSLFLIGRKTRLKVKSILSLIAEGSGGDCGELVEAVSWRMTFVMRAVLVSTT